ncbi:DUF5320 domain-containing protein [bacterium]|nr:DUF5320 domain-containing protein [bacterium]
MPGRDGTGPLGQGPFTGGGRGFCVTPLNNSTRILYGADGLQNYPVNIPYSSSQVNNSFINPLYPYYPYQSIGYTGRSVSYFRIRGGKGMRGRSRKF